LEKQIRDSTNKLIKLKSENGKFEDTGYNEVKKLLDVFQKKQVFMKRQFVLNNLAQFLRDRDMLPGIVFIFSRKNVERCAHEITVPLLEDDSKIPYTVKREAEQIVRRLPNFNEYLNLPEYKDLISLLEKGIGIHHSGMIPVLKEIVEILYDKCLIKVLLATETFAMGVNMPTKTVIFTNLTKFDGNQKRPLRPEEYGQMAGRAGRRGMDTSGLVVILPFLDFISENDAKTVMLAPPQKIISRLSLDYSLILKLLNNKIDIKNDEDPIKYLSTIFQKTLYIGNDSKLKGPIIKELDMLEKKLLELDPILNSEIKSKKDIYEKLFEINNKLKPNGYFRLEGR
jgi:antiviral helicase SKI2